MEILLALILLGVVLIVLGLPLLNSRPQTPIVATGALDDLEALRAGAYATLRDLDLDYQLGKLDESDYHSLREKYLARAAAILQQLDAVRGAGSSSALGDEIEKEVAALRRQTTTDSRPQVGAETPSADLRCSNCGRPYQRGDRFCAQCGQSLTKGERAESRPSQT